MQFDIKNPLWDFKIGAQKFFPPEIKMQKLIEKFEPVDCVAILLIFFVAVMMVMGIPDHTEAIATAILGFYFGHKLTISTTRGNKLNDDKFFAEGRAVGRAEDGQH